MQYIAQIALRLKVLPPQQFSGNNEAKEVLADENETSDEKTPVYRLIQNTGGTNIYYLIGASPADNIEQYHGILQPTQQLDCSGHRSLVSVFGAGAWQVTSTIMLRTDKYGDNQIVVGT